MATLNIMLSADQKKLIKMAQRDLGLPDDEYRETLRSFFGVESCTAPELGDEHLDKLLKFWEAVYWREVDRQRGGEGHTSASALPITFPSRVFSTKGFWQARNQPGNTSRDRYIQLGIEAEIGAAELQLRRFGLPPSYCHAIRAKIKNPYQYLAALKRTIAAKQKKLQPA
jgi:hypothetical protein